MMQYHFLILSLAFAVPGILIYGLRPDLRVIVHRLILCSIPFAFTESLFYSDYWEPKFLFDLAAKIGFGIEDFLFVMGLASFTGTVYAVVFRRTFYADVNVPRGYIALRLGILALITIGLTLIQLILSIPIIYGTLMTMLGVALGITWIRRDLIIPLFLGGLISTVVYFAICRIVSLVIPEIFQLNWNLDAFSATFILGVPLEELLYSFGAGAIGSVFYPFVFSCRYVALK
jgi:hypothetical protein